ncbi:hypothetical protein PIB30_083433, partial [Stylosanthes scabra]|nr:hypothetical protein [Stylosanthes scabra]
GLESLTHPCSLPLSLTIVLHLLPTPLPLLPVSSFPAASQFLPVLTISSSRRRCCCQFPAPLLRLSGAASALCFQRGCCFVFLHLRVSAYVTDRLCVSFLCCLHVSTLRSPLGTLLMLIDSADFHSRCVRCCW